MRSAPFDGIRLLDVSQRIAGRYASLLIAELGADVVRVDGPSTRHRTDRRRPLLDRSKRSIALRLQDGSGQETLLRLINSADVLISDLPPAEERRLGLDADAIDERFPDLVHCRIPPLADVDAAASMWTEDGGGAPAGLYAGQPTDDGDPHLLPIPFSAYAAGLLGATAVAAGLLQRRRTGRRVTITVPQFAAALLLHLPSLATSTEVRRLPRSADPLGPQPAYRLYRGSDDWFAIACPSRSFFDRLCLAIDRTDLALDGALDGAPWRIEDPDVRLRLVTALEEKFSTKPRSHWLTVLAEAEVPAAPVQERHEFMGGPLVAENGLAVTVAGRRQPAPPVRLGERAPPPTPAPEIGVDADDVLADPHWNRSARAGTAPGTAGALPLSGMRVLDLSSYFAGPLCGSLLADLGADVVKIEPPQGEGFRFAGLSFLSINRGKRGLCLDLGREEGRAALRRLAGRSDVLLTSLLPSRTKRLGLDTEPMLSDNPGLVACTISGFGNAEPRDRPTFDPLLQAVSGAAAQLGCRDRPHLYSTAISDAGAGLVALLGILSGLYDREASGRGGSFEANQVAGVMAIQAGEFDFAAEDEPVSERRPPQLGPSATLRLYRAADRWALLDAAERSSWQSLCRALGWSDLIDSYSAGEGSDGRLAEAVAARIAQRTAHEWTNAARGSTACLLPVQRPGEALQSELARSAGLVSEVRTPEQGRVRFLGPAIQVRGASPPPRRSAPELGEHSIEILSEAGFAPDDVQQLVDRRAVRMHGSEVPPAGADAGNSPGTSPAGR